MISADRLDDVISYNADSGIFTWISSNSCRIKQGDVAGSIKKHGYREIQVDKKSYLAHRLAWLYYYGSFPDGEIDHINHNKLDNRIANLREVDRGENNKNKSLMKNNTSGTVGVVWNKKSKKWQSQIKVDSRSIYLGLFSEYSEAVNARKDAEVKYNFHKNHGQE